MRLNLGSGDHRVVGWTNVDVWPGNSPDVVASMLELPFDDGSVDAAYAGHVLEHLTYDDELPRALEEVRRVLAPGAQFCAVGPDYDRALLENDEQLLAAIRGGEGRWPGDQHQWCATEALTLSAVAAVFPNARAVRVADVPPEWPCVSRVGWQCAVIAER